MKIYTLDNTDYKGGTEYFGTLADATTRGKELKRNGQDTVEIELHEVVKLTKEALLDILSTNGGMWSASSKVVKVL